MKITYKGKQTVHMTLTVKQLEAIRAALDSVCSYGDEGGSYKDCFKTEKAFIRALAKAKSVR